MFLKYLIEHSISRSSIQINSAEKRHTKDTNTIWFLFCFVLLAGSNRKIANERKICERKAEE
jgi:hypothetical protein